MPYPKKVRTYPKIQKPTHHHRRLFIGQIEVETSYWSIANEIKCFQSPFMFLILLFNFVSINVKHYFRYSIKTILEFKTLMNIKVIAL